MPAVSLELRYLFGAKFKDGTEYWQTQDDVSVEEPERRSASFDISQKHENGELVCGPDGFALLSDEIELFCIEGQGARYLVDLRDGSFRIQVGRSRAMAMFFVDIPPKGVKLLPLYFRRRRHHATATATANGDGTSSLSGLTEVRHECEYHFGWCYVDGDKVVSSKLILG